MLFFYQTYFRGVSRLNMSWEEDLKSGGRGNVGGVGRLESCIAIEILYSVSGHRLWTAEQSWFKFCCFPQTCQRSVLHADVLVLVNRLTRCSGALQLLPRRAAGRFLPSKQSSKMHDRNACSYYLHVRLISKSFRENSSVASTLRSLMQIEHWSMVSTYCRIFISWP